MDDVSDLLIKKDQEYARYVEKAKSEEKAVQWRINQDVLVEQTSIPGSTAVYAPTPEQVRFVDSLANRRVLNNCILHCIQQIILQGSVSLKSPRMS